MMLPSAPSQNGRDAVLAEVVEEFTNRVQAGEAVDVESYAQRHPEYAERIRQLLPALALLAEVGRSASAAREDMPMTLAEGQLSGTLGDFRILREVGRGGMGVVYEAEQISLRRRVALKVLPFAATMDARHLQRFQNEAQAAACLHHTNIVPVFSVGCERGVHFYAMQFIDGLPLSEVIRQLREREKKTSGTTAEREQTAAYQPSPGEAPTPPLVAELTPLSSEGPRSREYFRKVAELGVQAAEALDYAHQLGIVHRDIKPANLLLDGLGRLWITDFGLAHVQHSEASLTVTGQALGTPRYMSPEQALAQRVPIDHRTDVYSLGATLYELLTLRPAFESQDREELLRQIASDEPTRPRRWERAIPAELEIIVLKAMEKRPQDRYATAQELADDLRRWLLDQPIRARRPTAAQRLLKWGRRHRVVVTSAMAALLIVSIVSSLSAALVLSAYSAEKDAHQAEKQQREAATESEKAARQAETAARQAAAEATLQQRRAEDNLRKAVQAWGQSFEYFLLHPARKDTPELAAMRKSQTEQSRTFLQQLLQEVGGDPSRRSEAAMVQAELGRVFSAREDFVSAEKSFAAAISLYHRLLAESPKESRHQKALEDVYHAVVRIAGFHAQEAGGASSEVSQRRQVTEKYVGAARLYALAPLDWLPPATPGAENRFLAESLANYNAAKWLRAAGRSAEAEVAVHRSIAVGESVPARYPGQVWMAYCWCQQAQARFLQGQLRSEAGRLQEAEADYRQSLALFAKLKPEEMDSLAALPVLARLEAAHGELLWCQGNKQGAASAFRRAEQTWRQIKSPGNSQRHNELAWFLAMCPDEHFRKLDEAVALSEKAVTQQPKEASFWRTRGLALFRAGRHQDAAEALEKGMRLGDGGDAADWFFLAMTRWKLRDKAKAREWFHRAVGWMQKNRPRDPVLRRFHAEAAAVLEMQDAGS